MTITVAETQMNAAVENAVSLTDPPLRRAAVTKLPTDKQLSPDRQGNPYAPGVRDSGAHGCVDAEAESFILQAWLTRNRTMLVDVTAILFFALLAFAFWTLR